MLLEQKSRFKYPLLTSFFIVILIPLTVAVILIFSLTSQSLPQVTGVVNHSFVQSDVHIRRDEAGLVYIQAENDLDAFFAVGYAHAQDRLWQMEVQRRMAKGTLSEAFGRESLNFDIFIRTLGIYRQAQNNWQYLDTAAQKSLQAYSEGVNAWLSEQHFLPPEFVLLGIEPQSWTPVDSLAWMKMFALNLSSNYSIELENLVALSAVPAEKLLQVRPGIELPDTKEYASLINGKRFLHIIALQQQYNQLQEQWRWNGKMLGSNAWAIAAGKGDAQDTVLASDPHLSLEIPSAWYGISLQTPNLNVQGMGLPGLPIVFTGSNQNIAWGATNMMADTQDLYIEQLNPINQQEYLTESGWQTLSVREEFIKVKADFPSFLRDPIAPLTVRVRETRNGPLLSDLIPGSSVDLSLKWTGLQDTDNSYTGFLKANYANNWDEFTQAFEEYSAPALNLVYADVNDNIGLISVGDIPIRAKGNGNVPLSGASDSDQWQGFVPYEELPRQWNPESGYVVNANNNPATIDYEHFISSNFAPTARHDRICSLLQKDGYKTPNAQKQIQQDTIDLNALKLADAIGSLQYEDETAKTYAELLANWDGDTGNESRVAPLFFISLNHLRRALFADDFTYSWRDPIKSQSMNAIVGQVSLEVVTDVLTVPELSVWCDDINTASVESCADTVTAAFHRSENDLARLMGNDPDDWQWGDIHKIALQHRPFSAIRGLEFFFDREFEHPGSPDSVNASDLNFVENVGFEQGYGAAFRQLITFNKQRTDHQVINSTGQSGNVMSEFYDSMIPAYSEGGYVSFASKDQISEFSAFTITTTK